MRLCIALLTVPLLAGCHLVFGHRAPAGPAGDAATRWERGDPASDARPPDATEPRRGELVPIPGDLAIADQPDVRPLDAGPSALDLMPALDLTAPALDVSAKVKRVIHGFLFSHAKQRFVQQVDLLGLAPVSGPISLVLDGLTAGVSLFNKTGVTVATAPAGSPYINVDVGTDAVLSTGETSVVILEFEDPAKIGIQYQTRVLAGPGAR